MAGAGGQKDDTMKASTEHITELCKREHRAAMQLRNLITGVLGIGFTVLVWAVVIWFAGR